MNIVFYLIKDKENKKGKIPLYCQITVNGVQKVFSLGFAVLPIDWNRQKQRVKKSCVDADLINVKIDRILERFNLLKIKSVIEQKRLTALQVRDFVRENYAVLSFVAVFDNFVKLQEKRKDLGLITISTFSLWDFRKKSLLQWLDSKGLKDVCLNEIERKDFEAIKLFFLGLGYNINYIRKILEDFSRVLAFAVSEKIINENPFAGLSISEQYGEPIFLTVDELNQLIDFDFSENKYLDRIRDFFVFCCFTGLHYKDYINIVESNNIGLKIGVDGRTWIIGNRNKGLNQNYGKLALPLLQGAKNIIAKYGGVEHLPNLENQTFNKELKNVQKDVGLGVVLTCKIARNTFAYMALNVWNIPEKTVSKMLGHESTAMLKKYVRISEQKIANDTKDLI